MACLAAHRMQAPSAALQRRLQRRQHCAGTYREPQRDDQHSDCRHKAGQGCSGEAGRGRAVRCWPAGPNKPLAQVGAVTLALHSASSSISPCRLQTKLQALAGACLEHVYLHGKAYLYSPPCQVDSRVFPLAELTTAAREMEPAVGMVENAAAKKLHRPMAALGSRVVVTVRSDGCAHSRMPAWSNQGGESLPQPF